MAYSREKHKVYFLIQYNNRNETIIFDNVWMYKPKLFYIYLGKDNFYAAAAG